MPLVIAVLVGGIFLASGLHVTAQIELMLAKSGGVLASTGLVAFGVCMDYRFFLRFDSVVSYISEKYTYATCAIGLMQIFPLGPQHTFAMVVMTACPAAGISAMAARQFSQVSVKITDIMVGSTILSILTFPYWVYLAQTL